jgi:lysyl-tRNA synthetase class 2
MTDSSHRSTIRMTFLPSASLKTLQLRADLLARTRKFFDDRGFMEVETPILSADIVVDRHLDPISAVLADDVREPEVGRRLWLQTSPEFGMKRLLAAGATAIYQITRAFRNAEIGPLHNPEFTMVEWYRTGDDMQTGMALLGELSSALLGTPAAQLLSYRAAFEQHLGIDPHRATLADFERAAQEKKLAVPSGLGEDRDNWLNLLFAECVEPKLGRDVPTILYDYPGSQGALAKVRVDDSEPGKPPVEVAERFELYFHGIELANGYHELLDANILRRRNAAANAARAVDGKPQLPIESRLLAAMDAGLPPCAGVALGFDRVVMLASGAKSLAEVLAFPIDRA